MRRDDGGAVLSIATPVRPLRAVAAVLSVLASAAAAQALEIPAAPPRFVYDGAGLLSADERVPILTSRTFRSHFESSADLWLVKTGARLFSIFGALALFLAAAGVFLYVEIDTTGLQRFLALCR